MSMTREALDHVVIGAGIVGLSTALAIRRRLPDSRVALVDADEGSVGASQAAGAMLSGIGETVGRSNSTPGGRLLLQARLEATEYWPRWIDQELGLSEAECSYRRGTVLISNARSSRLDELNYKAILEHASASSVEIDEIDPKALDFLAPTTPDRPLRAHFAPSEAFVDAARFLSVLSQKVDADSRIERVGQRCLAVRSAGRSFEVDLESARIDTGTVVVAAGAGSLPLLARFADALRRIPLVLSGTGCALIASTDHLEVEPPYAVRTPNRAFACGLHLVPSNRGGAYIGATNNVEARPSSSASFGDVAFLIECASRQLHHRLSESRLRQILVGRRPLSADTFPIFGQTSVEGLWLVTATHRDGFALAPLIAREIAAGIDESRSAVPRYELFKPERAPLQCTPDIASAINAAVENYAAIAFERGTVVPATGDWEGRIGDAVRGRVAAIYERLESDFRVSPDFLWDLEHGDLFTPIYEYLQELSLKKRGAPR